MSSRTNKQLNPQNLQNAKNIIQNKKAQQKMERSINYTQLRTLKETKNKPLLAGLQHRDKNKYKKTKPIASKVEQYHRQPSKLLVTALDFIKKKTEDLDAEPLQIQDGKSSRPNNVSYYFDSRQITPINPILGNSLNVNNQMNRSKSKNRMKTHQTNKSRLQSITSQLYQNDSQAQSSNIVLAVHKQKDFKLYNNILGQSQAVFQYALGKSKKLNPKLIYNWKDCLLHQDKTQIFVPVSSDQPTNIPYTHPRVFPLNELEKGFDQVYGMGKQRCLKIGEESLVIEGIQRYLKKCDKQPMKIARKDFDIISDVLADCKLLQLENYPVCYKQIQGHLKILATRWKYDNISKKADKQIESAIINGKANFVDLGKSGVLTDFLLKNSNRDQYI